MEEVNLVVNVGREKEEDKEVIRVKRRQRQGSVTSIPRSVISR